MTPRRVWDAERPEDVIGLHLVEQQAYLSEREGRSGWLRIMCAGYRPIE